MQSAIVESQTQKTSSKNDLSEIKRAQTIREHQQHWHLNRQHIENTSLCWILHTVWIIMVIVLGSRLWPTLESFSRNTSIHARS